MKEEYIRWYTKHLSREFEMLVFGEGGYPIIAFPTSCGRYYQNKDFKLIESASTLLESGTVKIYCPDGIDDESWYNYSIHPSDRVKTHIAYENVILHDVIERAIRETKHNKVGVAGCSFGGYHAANLAFRHPDKIGQLLCMSGAFDIKQFIFGYYDENCYYHNPFDYLPNLKDAWYLDRIRQMNIILGTGEWDSCRDENIKLSQILHSKGVQHWLDDRMGTGHDWPWWREMFPHYLAHIR